MLECQEIKCPMRTYLVFISFVFQVKYNIKTAEVIFDKMAGEMLIIYYFCQSTQISKVFNTNKQGQLGQVLDHYSIRFIP